MKKIIAFAASAVALVACSEMYGPQDDPTPVTKAEGIEITVSDVTDTSFTVTLAPQGAACYYSYLVDEDTKVYSLDSSYIYSCSYNGVVAKGTFKYDAEHPTSKFTITDTDRNATYQIYAVSSSVEGIPGSVAVKTVKTSDTQNPELEDYDFKDSVVTLYFSEDVALAKDAKFTANVYAKYQNQADGVPVSAITLSAENVTENGDEVEIVIPGLHAGANYGINFDKGTFVDAVGNPADALVSKYFTNSETSKLDSTGVTGRVANAQWPLSIYGGGTVEVVTNMASPIWMSVPADTKVYNFNSAAKGTLVYETSTETHTYTAVYGSTGGYLFGWNSNYSCALSYPNYAAASGRPDPERGANVTVNLPSFLVDIYGNWNEPFTIGPFLYSYGYKVSDITGTYQFSSTSAYASYGYGPYTNSITIAASDDADKGNVKFTGTLSDLPVSFYGDFDLDRGTLSLAKGVKIGTCQDYLYDNSGNPTKDASGNYIMIDCDVCAYLSNGSNYYSDQLGFDVPSAHTLDFWWSKYYFGLLEVYQDEPYGWYDLLKISSITNLTTSSKGVSAPAAASVKKAGLHKASFSSKNVER